MKALGEALADGDLRRAGVCPPFALEDFVAGGRRVRPGEADVFKHAAGQVLILELVESLAIERAKLAADRGHEFKGLRDAGLMREEVADAGSLVGGDVDEEDVREFGGGGLADLTKQSGLHEINRENEHDAGA